MVFIDLTNPVMLMTFLAVVMIFIIIGRKAKTSMLPAIALVFSLISLVVHAIQVLNLSEYYSYLAKPISNSMVVDFILIFISFIAYLWVDDIEAKLKNTKSYDDSLDWLWKKM